MIIIKKREVLQRLSGDRQRSSHLMTLLPACSMLGMLGRLGHFAIAIIAIAGEITIEFLWVTARRPCFFRVSFYAALQNSKRNARETKKQNPQARLIAAKSKASRPTFSNSPRHDRLTHNVFVPSTTSQKYRSLHRIHFPFVQIKQSRQHNEILLIK